MSRITAGNRLYLYRLFKNQVGTGKQERIQRFEEVLAADDIAPDDLDCKDVTELLGALDGMVKLTVFKKGRTYATLLANPELDAALAAAEAPSAQKKAVQSGKSWKRKKSAKVAKPAKPRHKKQKPAPKAAPEPVAKTDSQPTEELAMPAGEKDEAPQPQHVAAAEPKADASATATEVEAPTETTSESTPQEHEGIKLTITYDPTTDQDAASPAPQTQPAPAPKPEAAAQAEPAPEPAPIASPQPAPTTQPAAGEKDPDATAKAAPEPKAAPVVEDAPSISLTITYDPTQDEEPAPEGSLPAEGSFSFEEQRPTVPARPAPQQQGDAVQPEGPALSSQSDLPQTISLDVHCKDEFLRALYQMLLLDVDVMGVLDEDWSVARSTALLTGTRSRVTFPLRYLHEDDGTPVTITLKRSAKASAGKRWSISCIDGDDGTGAMHEPVGIEGLPTVDEGAWSELSGPSHDTAATSPIRELARFAMVGSWESYLGALATMAAPEHWDFPGEGVGKPSRYGILREYLCVTFHRAQAQGLVAQAADGSLAAFDTGLFTPFGQDIYACFTPNRGDIRWKSAGFCVAGSGELGGELVAKLDPLPRPVSYLRDLGDVTPDTSRLAVLDTDAILTHRLGVLPRAFLEDELQASPTARDLLAKAVAQEGAPAGEKDHALLARAIKSDPGLYRRLGRALDEALALTLCRVRASYRIAAPAYDPATDSVRLLLPLCLVSDSQADCALVLAPQPSGNYQGVTIMSLDRARVCARVISAEQPAWLGRAAAQQ
ncbi:MAG: DUF3825 domain-containing protein [Parafannyhessea umbonata]|uniref:DUF3825 domain-containing protein n=1 Tax=Parafannyhessea umbonata TaxID=604330 RepID=UPI0026EF5040|nr:DUF3825 domain-containing protein [Parafannyhessea umbonata]MCI6680876.1 DUF3825 domain-containing protein [Parafannyhessea umbonata]